VSTKLRRQLEVDVEAFYGFLDALDPDG